MLFLVIFTGTADAMKHRYEAYEKRNELISFKSLQGLPLISLDKGKEWAAQLSKKQLQKVRKHIKWQKDKRFITLFRMIALPQDVQRLIAAHIFEDEEAEYKNAANMFCTMPLCDVLNQYALSLQPVKNKGRFNQKLLRDPCYKPHIVFEHIYEINVCRECFYRSDHRVSKKELACINKVIDTFSLLKELTEYRHSSYQYKSLPITNFKKQFNRDQFCLLLAFLASYVLLTFRGGHDCVLNQDKVELNRVAHDFNKKLDCLYHKTGNKYLLERRVQLFNEYDCVINGVGYYNLSAVVTMFGLALYGGYRLLCLIPHGIEERHTWPMIKMGVGTIMTVYLMPFILSYMSSQLGEGSPGDIPYLVILYGLLCSGYNLGKMRLLQKEYVTWKDIPQLLQRTDITIV